MPPHILIADPDEAFGLMLKQVLELNGSYSAEHVSSGSLALASIGSRRPDLVIIDMMLADIALATLIGAIRESVPQSRFMLIPLDGAHPADNTAIGDNGTLSKPFFIGDLAEQIAAALGTEVKPLVTMPPPQAVTPAPLPPSEVVNASPLPLPPSDSPPSRPPLHRLAQTAKPVAARPVDAPLDGVLASLAAETRAEAIFVVANGAVVEQRSDLTDARVERLLERLNTCRKAIGDLAALWGERGGFARLQLESERLLLATHDLDAASYLLVVCRSDVPLGALRLNMRSAANRLTGMLRERAALATSPNPK